MKFVSILFIFSICAASAVASENAAAFLDIKVGARPAAMGGAYTAVVHDATAVYWNPAGLGVMEHFQLISSVLNYKIGDDSAVEKIGGGHYFMAMMMAVPKIGTIGFAWKRFSMGDIELRQDETTALGTFDDAENAFYFGWGHELVQKSLSVGMNLKFVQQAFTGLEGAKATGAGVGLGLLFSIIEPLKLGMCVEDDFHLKWDNEIEDEVPFKSRVGLAYTTFKNNLTLTGDVEQKRYWPLWASVGAEYRIRPNFLQTDGGKTFAGLALRGGLAQTFLENRYSNTDFQKANNFSGGFGFLWNEQQWYIRFDYAYSTERLGMRHRFTFTIGL